MPIISSTAPATANPTPPQKNDMKPLGLCLTPTSSLEIPTVIASSAAVVNLTAAAVASGARHSVNSTNSSNSFYPCTTSVTTPGQFQMGPLSVMVAKFTSNPSVGMNNRQQTVILQPRTNTATRAMATLPMNPIRGSTVISSQTISPALTSTTSSISVRTRVLSGQNHQTNAVPILNLSAVTNSIPPSGASLVHPPGTGTVKQMIKGQKIISSSGNLETVNLVMTTPTDVRNIRTNSNSGEIKANMLTVQNINSKMNGPKSVNLSGSTIVAQPKMISINSGQSTATNVCQRLGILSTGGNKPGIINLTTALPKSFIFTTPNPSQTGTGATVANMVSLSSAPNFVTTGQPLTKISVTPNHIIAGGTATVRYPVATASVALPPSNNHTGVLSPKATIYTVATTSTNALNSVSNLHQLASFQTVPQALSYSQSISTTIATISSTTSSTVSTASIVNVRPAIIAANHSPANKPSFYLQGSNSNSPNSRTPRILSRKRINSESPTTITVKAANGTAFNSFNSNSTTVLTSVDQIISPLASSANSTEYQPLNVTNVKSEISSSSLTCLSNAVPDILPRKKPRKQLLEPSVSPKKEGECDVSCKSDPDVEATSEPKEAPILVKRPRPLLRETKGSQYYLQSAKSQSTLPHFLRYSDVKPKPDKKVAITDLLGEVQKPNVGWKISHLAEQLLEASNEEVNTVQNTLENFLQVLEKDISPFSACASNSTLFGDPNADKVNFVDKICVKINDLTRANLQRTNVILEHYKESQQLLLKLTTDHKEKVTGLAKRIGHKRGFVKS